MKLTLVLCFNGWLCLVLIPFQNISENVRWLLIFQFISPVDVLPYLSLYEERVQLSLECRFLKRNSLKFSEILFDLVPNPSEEYKWERL